MRRESTSGSALQIQAPSPTSADFFGGHSEEDPPVPIPNTEVKLFSADGTAWETMWESRSPPNSLPTSPCSVYSGRGFLRPEGDDILELYFPCIFDFRSKISLIIESTGCIVLSHKFKNIFYHSSPLHYFLTCYFYSHPSNECTRQTLSNNLA